jgi:hypothetical protein
MSETKKTNPSPIAKLQPWNALAYYCPRCHQGYRLAIDTINVESGRLTEVEVHCTCGWQGKVTDLVSRGQKEKRPPSITKLRHGMTVGGFPPHCQHERRMVNAFRTLLEREVLQLRGEISAVDASMIECACHFHRHSVLARRLLRTHGGKMSALEQLKFSDAISGAAEKRHRALLKLGLTPDTLDPAATLYNAGWEHEDEEEHKNESNRGHRPE